MLKLGDVLRSRSRELRSGRASTSIGVSVPVGCSGLQWAHKTRLDMLGMCVAEVGKNIPPEPHSTPLTERGIAAVADRVLEVFAGSNRLQPSLSHRSRRPGLFAISLASSECTRHFSNLVNTKCVGSAVSTHGFPFVHAQDGAFKQHSDHLIALPVAIPQHGREGSIAFIIIEFNNCWVTHVWAEACAIPRAHNSVVNSRRMTLPILLDSMRETQWWTR